MRPITRVLWWLGWHPRYSIAGGAVLGFLLGNVVVTWAVRASMLRGGLATALAPLRQVVGGGGTFLLVLAVLPVVGSILFGAVLGLGAWLVGVWTVNRHAGRELARALDGAARDPDSGGRGDDFLFSVATDDGTPPLVSRARSYDVARLRTDETGVSVAAGHLSLPDRRVERQREGRLRYEDLRAIAYADDDRTLRLETDDDRYAVRTGERPADLLTSLRDRGPSGVIGDADSSAA
ncbi:MAG: hypothetical protein ABEJ89_06030 [Haloarculaceae archaeon]